MLVVALREVCAEVTAAALLAAQRRARDQPRDRDQIECAPQVAVGRGLAYAALSCCVRAIERHDRILQITINRPDQRNAVNAAVAEGISAALDELDEDRELSVGVITGAGKGFSAGMDLKGVMSDPVAMSG